jgi:hypothetical protein
MSFTRREEDFKCERCGREVAGNGYTNHCPGCLWSKHVDKDPGDRAESCGGMMEPVAIEMGEGSEAVILQACVRCGARRRCKRSPEDSFDAIVAIARKAADAEAYGRRARR